jgi:hypothetical protein
MKPVLILCLIVSCCCALPGASADEFYGPEAAANGWPVRPQTESWPAASGHPFGHAPAPPIPYGFLWEEYRGAAIEHNIHGLNGHLHCSPRRPAKHAILSIFEMFDGLLCSLTPPRRSEVCANCDSGSSMSEPVVAPQTHYPMPPRPATLRPAPEFSLDEIPAEEPKAVGVPGNAPDAFVPVPAPQPDEPARAPVVELAPDFALPPEPAKPAPPRNRIPSPGGPPPQNVIPGS